MPLQRSAEGTTRNINGREDLSCDPRQLQHPVAAALPPSVEQTEPASSRYITHTPTTYTHKMTARVRKRSMQQRVGRETVWQIEQYGWEGQRFPHSLFVKSNGMLTSYISSGMCPNQVYVHISLGRLLDISLLLPCLFLSCVFFIIACRSGCSLILHLFASGECKEGQGVPAEPKYPKCEPGPVDAHTRLCTTNILWRVS